MKLTNFQDFKVFDTKSVALESGRYMETLGFMSINGLSKSGAAPRAPSDQSPKLTFSRRYIDNNLYSMHHHAGKDAKSFPTKHGLKVSKAIGKARKSLDLTHKYGCAPQDYWVSRRPYPHNESIFSLIEARVLPDEVAKSARIKKEEKKALVITNTGGIRFDIFKGAFTKDTKFLVSPFTSGIRYIPDVPYKAASQVIKLLNNEGPIMLEMMAQNAFLQPPEIHAARHRPHLFANTPSTHETYQINSNQNQIPFTSEDPEPFPGYTTTDDAGTNGDDTIHSPIQFFNVPNCVQSVVGFNATDVAQEPEHVDLMYNEFIQKWLLMALEYQGVGVGVGDTQSWEGGRSFTEVLTGWVEGNWEGKC